jgi:hypothetical protein
MNARIDATKHALALTNEGTGKTHQNIRQIECQNLRQIMCKNMGQIEF